jgi:hypothetical protein
MAGRPTQTGASIKCKQCGVHKSRLPQGKNTQKRTLYVCSDGKHWSGMVCPTCHNANRANAYEPSVAPRGRSPVSYVRRGTKLRSCRTCGIMNVNYYDCRVCLANKAYNNDAYRFAEINGMAL